MNRLAILLLPFVLSACAGMQDYSYEEEQESEPVLMQMQMFVYPDTPGNRRSRSYGHVLSFPLFKPKVVTEHSYNGGED